MISEMDHSVKRMLDLIEEEGESFAEKAEIVYENRPELIAQVEEFYRMYRSLAERYDHLLVDLRKNVPSDYHSQGSFISDLAPESLDSPGHRVARNKSVPRAAGFEVFLGLSSADSHHHEGDEYSSLTDSESQSDDSSVNNYGGMGERDGDPQLNRKEKEKRNNEGVARNRIAEYEEKLSIANDRIVSLEEEIARLNADLQKISSSEVVDDMHTKEKLWTKTLEDQEHDVTSEAENSGHESVIQSLEEELRLTKDKLWDAEKEIDTLRDEIASLKAKSSEKQQQLQDQLELANNELATWKAKNNTEKREVTKLQEIIGRLKTSLLERDHEVWDLRKEISDMEKKIFPEKAEIKAKLCKLLEERNFLAEQVREWEPYSRYLEEEIQKARAKRAETEERLTNEVNQVKEEIAKLLDQMEASNKSLEASRAEKEMLNEKVLSLEAKLSSRDAEINEMKDGLNAEQAELITSAEEAHKEANELKLRAKCLEEEVERQKAVNLEVAEEKKEVIRQLSFSIEHYRSRCQRLQRAFKGTPRVNRR